MVTLNFRTFPKMTIQDGLDLVFKAKLDIINLIAEKQKAKGLILMMTKSGEIILVHISSRISNGRLASPSSKASHVMPSFLQQMMTL